MKVTILGASPVIPNPGGACSGILVQSGQTALLVDCGIGIMSQLQRFFDYYHLSGVVISHMHADHCLDLVTLRYALKYGPHTDMKAFPDLFLPPKGYKLLHTIGKLFDEEGSDFFEEQFKIKEYDPVKPLVVGPFTLTFAPTKHYIPCWAMRVEAEGRTIAYSADTGPEVDLTSVVRDADLFICESGVSSRRADPNTWGHLDPVEAGEIARTAGAKRLVITHIWHEFDRSAMLEAAATAFGGPTHLATEGQVYVV